MTTQGDRQRQLLVVGAGPVGLCAALCAARAGLDVELIDQSFRGFGRGYATLLHPAVVQTFERLGVGDKLRRAGREITGIGVNADGSERMRLELPSPALAVAQGVLEQTLLTALRELDVPLSAPCEASTILQDSSKVAVRVVRRELVTYGSPAEYSDWAAVDSSLVRADFVIGADGYDSRVRTALGIDCATLGETESFAMFEVAAHEAASSDIELGFTGGLVSAVIPLPSGRARVGFQLNSGLDLEPNVARLHELVRTRAPWFQNGQQQVDWGTVIHFERRLVRRFGVERVWLAGDAAHVTSPFGAQSMNLGLLEAEQFVGDIVQCVKHGAPIETVHEHSAERLREWHKLLGYNVRFDLLTNAPTWLPAYARRVAPVMPASGPDLKKVLEQVGLRLS